MKRILHISNYYYPNIGGIESACRDFVNVYKEKGYEQKVICFGDGPNLVDDIDIIRISYKIKIRSQAISFKYFHILKKLIRTFNPDVIFIHTPNPLIEKYLLNTHYKGKIIVYHHLDVYKQKILKFFIRPIQRKLNKRANLILCHSQNYVDQSSELKDYKDKVEIIPLCYKEKDFILSEEEKEEVNKIKEKYKDKLIVFLSGRHTKTKGIDIAVEATKFNNNIVFILGRTGKKNHKFEKIIANSNVVYLGLVDRRQYATYLTACDVFIFPSIGKNEAFPITLIEALSRGKPSIIFDVPGSSISYISPDGLTSIMCENKNVEELKNAINRLYKDEELRNKLSENAKKRASSLFNYENFKDKILNLIND